MKKSVSSFEQHLPEVLAVGLVVVMSAFLGTQWTRTSSQAQTATDPNDSVIAELTDAQPLRLDQLPDQQVAQFKLSTTSTAGLNVTSLTFYALGDLRYRISKQLTLLPLVVTQQDRVIGTGVEWTQEYGTIQQQVTLAAPLKISKDNPATIDVSTDLTKLRDYTFGLELTKAASPSEQWELSTPGQVFKIKAFP